MSDVQLNRIQPEGAAVLLVKQQVEALYNEISRRAYELFLARGGLHGYDREDWLEAERSLIFAPPAELIEQEDEFGIRIALPGFDASQVRVNVLPRMIIVDGDPSQRAGGSHQRLLRCLEMPGEIRTFTAKATLGDGILHINVRKASPAIESDQQSASAVA